MRLFRRHWYDIGLLVAVLAVVALVFLWHDMGVLQRLLLLNFITLLIHQYEEYGWPGGGPAIANIVTLPNPAPNRYPLNQNNAMVINVFVGYPFYILPVFFPHVIWLGLAPVLFGMLQFVVHGVLVNVKMKSLYNPGLAAVVLGHIPIGVYYLYYVHAHDLASVWEWVLALLYMFALQFVLMLKLGYGWLADRNSPFAFDEVEMRRFSVQEKMDRLRRTDANTTAG
jgi:hypothetical protein